MSVLDTAPPGGGCIVPVDAEIHGDRVLRHVVMSGMGADGRDGAAWIEARGGGMLTEAEESMSSTACLAPLSRRSLSDEEVPLHHLASAITERI